LVFVIVQWAPKPSQGSAMQTALEDDADFRKILETVLKIKGFDGLHYKVSYIKRRIAVRMRATHVETYGEYLKVLLGMPEESTQLLDRLTIHVTDFFRDSSVYQALQEKIFPEFIPKSLTKKIRVWSAGCSTGEEAYSAAFLMRELCKLNAGLSFEILATDIDAESIRIARNGEYSSQSIQKISKKVIGDMFKAETSRFKVIPNLRKSVRFLKHDLLGDWPFEFTDFDLVFCRNLLIYLTAIQQQKLYERFYRVLVPGGYLVLGLTETLLGPARELFNCVDVRNRIYKAIPGNDSYF
jgi:chemotaxis methyl-accepting protein methylase